MSKVYLEMLEALRTSVLEIDAADAADRAERLKKQFDAYGKALTKRLEEDLPLAVDEADPVSLLGDRVGRLNEVVGAIERGLVPGHESVSEDSLMLAKGIVEFGGLALNACAADFAEPVEEGAEVEEGKGLYKLASPEGEVLFKSSLPEHAATLTADPADTAEKLAEFCIDALEWLGVDLSRLAKKAPPPFAKKGEGDKASEEKGATEGGEEDPEDPEDPEASEEPEDPDEGEEPENLEGGSPLDNIARLTSLALLELDNIKQQLGDVAGMEDPEGGLSALDAIGQHLALAVVQADALNSAAAGGGEEELPQGEAGDTVAGAAAGGPADAVDQGDMPSGEGEEAATPEEEEAEKGVKDGPLAKALASAKEMLAKAEQASKQAKDAEARAAAAEAELDRLKKAAGAQPADPKAATGVGATALSKTADGGGAESESLEEREKRLAELMKRNPELAAAEMIKAAHRNPIRVT